MALFVGFDAVWVSMVGLGLWGIGQGHNWVLATAEVQVATPDHLLGRVTAIDFFMFSMGSALAAVLAGLLCDAWDDPAAGAWVTAALAGLGWLYCLALSLKAPADNPDTA